MTRKFFLLAMILLPVAVHALSLNEARSMARDNYPAIRQYRMIEQSRDFTLDNVMKGWLPQVSISAGAYGFTDILKSDKKMEQAGMDMNNFMANASVMIKQSVYDGGQIAARKRWFGLKAKCRSSNWMFRCTPSTNRLTSCFSAFCYWTSNLNKTHCCRKTLQQASRPYAA